ncbi:hypothetical protein CJ030_MR4G015725 [Morella rubra]|uniref:Uncharacterized protein n=1 Tax=Morella rubra TaxID=262757 RepID=A0A6A1VYK9_9ROSI|nr:hypothetical protein CJ030_MR4G015725 [Morella rubra]
MENQQGPLMLEEKYCPKSIEKTEMQDPHAITNAVIRAPSSSPIGREISAALSPPRRTPEDPEAGEVPARGPPTSPVVDFKEFSQSIESTETVQDPHAITDAVIRAPSSSPTGREISCALSPTRRTPEDPEAGEVPARGPPTSPAVDFVKFLSRKGPPSTNGIPDAMSPAESPGATGTLLVFGVNRPIRSSLEAGRGPPRTDETSAALSPTRRTPEDPTSPHSPVLTS